MTEHIFVGDKKQWCDLCGKTYWGHWRRKRTTRLQPLTGASMTTDHQAAVLALAKHLDHSMGPERRRRLAGYVLTTLLADPEARSALAAVLVEPEEETTT